MSVEKNFIESLKILNHLKINFILSSGVNLSLTRDKKFFDHEDNIDFLILRKDLNKKKILKIKKHFKIKKYFEYKRKNKIAFIKNNIRVKFSILDQNSKFKDYYIHNNLKFLKTFMDNKIHKFYKKNKYYIPLKNEKYLDFHYGNWRKKPKFPADSTTYTSHRIYVNEKQVYLYKIYRIFVNNIKKIIK